MTTAVIGLGSIGKAVALHLAQGGEQLIVAAHDMAAPLAFAKEQGGSVRAASVDDAVAEADTIVFAVWLDVIREMIGKYQTQLPGKTFVDPSNPIKAAEGGNFVRTLPDGVSSGQLLSGMLPAGTRYVKAFGSLGAPELMSQANAEPRKVLFYATDDADAEQEARRIISAAGFDPVRAGGVDAAIEIEVFGALHPAGGLDGKVLTAPEAEKAVAALNG